MISVGLDISTHCGIARTDGQEHLGRVVNFPLLRGWARLQSIARDVGRSLEGWKPDIVVLEGFAYGNANSLATLVECATVIKQELYRQGLGWWVVQPSVLKKWTTGNGAASKELMAAKVYERWAFRSPSDDIVDAFALAQMGQLGPDKLASFKGVSHGN